MSVFLQMSLVGVGVILWVLRSTLRTHIPCEGGWLRCRSSSLLVNEWFRRGVAGSQSFGHRRYIHWKYGRSTWGTRWVLAQDVCGCGLVGWEPLPLQKFSWVFEFSWESHEILMRKWHSHENFPILMRISHEVFCSWESHFSHENWKLIRISWDSHEILMRKWHSHEIFSWAFLLVRISFFSRALKAHESLMRFSWENPLTKTLFLLFLMTVSCIPSINKHLLRMWFHEFSRSHAKVNIRCMHVVLVKENHFEGLSSSKLNMFTWVETRLCVLVHVRLLVTWQRTNSVTIDRVTAFDHEAIVRIRTIVIRSFCGLRLRSFQVRF